ncbi:ankyrin repeat domain-containing protein 63-like [Megalops cyprinoides]|uniref:ankyrin repeat domain-containing protein 63-like n=1 Tax=Megalops cyprinoides TaxID=118141 RepID=UPI001864D986|nr:ankyrin repeat domain-containing protein 63-like [Megalops cyprinoides]
MPRPRNLCQGSGTRTFLDAMCSGKVHLARIVLNTLDGQIIDLKTEDSRTPLMLATCLPDPGTRLEFAQLLLEKGANVNCRDGQGRTALSLACELGHLDAVKLLVSYSADPEISDMRGNSALMHAARCGHCQVLEFLVWSFRKLGLRLDHTNRAGQSAIQVANLFGHEHCVRVLCVPEKRRAGLSVRFGREQGGVHPKFTKLSCNRYSDRLPEIFQRKLRIVGGNRLETSSEVQKSRLGDLPWAKAWGPGADLPQCEGSQGRETTQETSLFWGETEPFKLQLLPRLGDPFSMSLFDGGIKRWSMRDGLAPVKEACRQNTCPAQTDDGNQSAAESSAPPISGAPEPLESSLLPNVDEQGDDTTPESWSPSHPAPLERLAPHREDITTGKVRASWGLTRLKAQILRRFSRSDSPCPRGDVHPDSKRGKGRMSRSEAFPLLCREQAVSAQPSVYSISGVRCEFDSGSKNVSPHV